MNSSFNSSERESSRLIADGLSWFWIASIAIAIITIIGNSIVVLLIAICTRLRSTQNAFVLSLAVADLSIGLFLTPTMFACGAWIKCDHHLQIAFYNFLLFASTCNLLGMTLDRFIAVVYPFRYQSIMTNKVTVLLLIISWITPFVVSFIRLSWRYTNPSNLLRIEYYYMLIMDISFGLIPCITLLITYCRIYMIVRKHRIQDCHQITHVRYNHQHNNNSNTNDNDRSMNNNNNSGDDTNINIVVPQFPAPRQTRGRGIKSVEFLGCVIVMFVVCYCFHVTVSFCVNIKLCTVNKYASEISVLLVMLNSAINFLVYSILKADFRRELLRVSR